MPRMRRVVTGHDANGKAIVVEDGEPPVTFARPETPGLTFFEVWNTQGAPAKISAKNDPTRDRPVKVPPPKNGTIIRVIDFPPEDPNKPKPPMELAGKLFELMGLHPVTDPKLYERHPFMHRTSSVDYGIVLEGSMTLLLDDTEIDLKAGDVVVQNHHPRLEEPLRGELPDGLHSGRWRIRGGRDARLGMMASELDRLFDAASKAPRQAGRVLIKGYRYTLSPLIGFRCRHLPSCSEYGDEALARHGLWAGGWMTLSRFCRCGPFGTSGLDFVPDALPPRARWYMPWRYGRWRGTNESPPAKQI